MDDLKIKFISHANEALASHRMRVLKPVELLKKRGYEVSFGTEVEEDDDIVVFQKHINPAYDFNMCGMAQARGKKVIFDVSDNHFKNKELAPYYQAMIRKADLVTCCGPGLQHLIAMVTGRKSFVIRDPITFPRVRPTPISNPPKTLWFGHASNMESLKKYIYDIPNLTIITNQLVKVPNANVQMIQWQPGLVEALIPKFDVVILPVGEDKIWKNENRAVDAIQGGCFVITDTLRPYAPLRDHIFVGDIIEGLGWAGANPMEAMNLVLQGQEHLDKEYNDEKLTDQWESAIKEVINARKTKSIA